MSVASSGISWPAKQKGNEKNGCNKSSPMVKNEDNLVTFWSLAITVIAKLPTNAAIKIGRREEPSTWNGCCWFLAWFTTVKLWWDMFYSDWFNHST